MFNLWHNLQEEVEDTKGVIRIRISEKEQTTQWPKEKAQKDKQRSTKHTHKTKDQATRTPPKIRRWTQVLRKGSSSTCVKCNIFPPLVGIYSNDNKIKLTDYVVLLNMLYIVGFTQWHSLSNHLIRYCFVINSISGSYDTVVVTLK